jgi:hypothetical protein
VAGMMQLRVASDAEIPGQEASAVASEFIQSMPSRSCSRSDQGNPPSSPSSLLPTQSRNTTSPREP